jgi:hypothetical protein
MKNVRIWQLGSIEEGIMPTKEALENLHKTIKEQDDSNTINIIWGPDPIKVTQYHGGD